MPTTPLLSVLEEMERADDAAARLDAVVTGLQSMGFGQVVGVLFDAALNPVHTVGAGREEAKGLPLAPLPGAVWRRRITQLERLGTGDVAQLRGTDAWVAREFFGTEPAAVAEAALWQPTDVLAGVLRGPHQQVLGILLVAHPDDGAQPTTEWMQAFTTVMRLLAARVAYDALDVVARRRQARLQLLQEAGASLTRSLDEQEILQELIRQVQRAVRADGVALLIPDLDAGMVAVARHVVHGSEVARTVQPLADGLVTDVARSGQPQRVGDRDADRARAKSGHAPLTSLADISGESIPSASAIAVPMRVGLRLLGVLAVHAADADVFTPDDEEMLSTLASQAATAIANARRYAESERERRTTEALADVARAVSESLRLGEVHRLILRHAVSLLGAEGACIALGAGEYLHIVAAFGSADVLSGVHLPVDASLMGRAVRTNQPVVVNDPRGTSVARAVQQLYQVERAVIAPLVAGSGTIGAIAVLNRPRPFDDEDTRVLQRLADQVAVAIVNARLFEEVERITRQWKLAFDGTASGIVVLEESLIVSRCNTRAAELCALSIPSLLGRHFLDVLLREPNVPERRQLEQTITRALQDRERFRTTVPDPTSGHAYALVISPHPEGGCVITFDLADP